MQNIAIVQEDSELLDMINHIEGVIPHDVDLTNISSISNSVYAGHLFVARISPSLKRDFYLHDLYRAVTLYSNGLIFVKTAFDDYYKYSHEEMKEIMHIVNYAAAKGFFCVLNDHSLFMEALGNIKNVELRNYNIEDYVLDENNAQELYEVLTKFSTFNPNVGILKQASTILASVLEIKQSTKD